MLLEWLNNNSGTVSALATVAMLIVTIAYVWINSRMHSEMKHSRILSQTPALSIRLERVMSGFFDIVIENTTSNSAYDIHFNQFPTAKDLGVKSIPKFFESGINYMAPGQKYRSFYLNFPKVVLIYRDELPDLSISYTYFDEQKKKHQKSIIFNLSAFYDNSTLGTGVEIYENLSAIKTQLENLNTVLAGHLKSTLNSQGQDSV